jgi:AcrR family transcriptional regulator
VEAVDSKPSRVLSGRRGEAERNDARILEAARSVFVADPGAPVSSVAKSAGVGISALYRRYPSKEELLRKLCADGLAEYIAAAEAALDDTGDPWTAFTHFMHRVVNADSHSLTLRLAGTFTPTEELRREAERARGLDLRLVERMTATGAIRADLSPIDLSFLFEQLAAVRVRDEDRTRELRLRYLSLQLDALQNHSGTSLPETAPSWKEISERWEPVPDG